MTTFLKGSKVRRKMAYRSANSWPFADKVLTVLAIDEQAKSLYLQEDETAQSWNTSYFEPVLDEEAPRDPNGIDQHAPGAKLDAGKLRPDMVLGGFVNALACVARVGTDGAAKYSDGGWREVPNGFARYGEAELRHRMRRQAGEVLDPESNSLHLAHEAWNALAKLELFLAVNPEHKVL